MKVKLYVVNHKNHEGLYTESEFEDLKQEHLEEYRDSTNFLDNLSLNVEPRVLVGAALGDEEAKKIFDFEVEKNEEKYWMDFVETYAEIYEKEI